MITNSISDVLKKGSKALYLNFQNNSIVVRHMLKKYKKEFPHISDYSILHYLDIIELCELIMGPEAVRSLNSDECYCVLMSALFVYAGLGTTEKTWEKFAPGLGLDPKEGDRGLEVRAHYAYFSACLLDYMSDVLELPSADHRNCIKDLMLGMGGEIIGGTPMKDIILENGSVVRMSYLGGVLTLANELSELQNRNMDMSKDNFHHYKAEEIMGFIERLSTASFRREDEALIVEVSGSDTVISLMKRKIDRLQEKVKETGEHCRTAMGDKPLIEEIVLHRMDSPDSGEEIFLNMDIENRWSQKDKDFYARFTADEKTFYMNYLSSEYSVTNCLKEFAEHNQAQLSGLEFRVKSPASVYTKLHKPNANRTLDTIADVIRYTVILEPEKYVGDTGRILEALEKEGWQLYSLENHWMKKIPYNAVNSNLRNRSNIRTEIQFHTPESFKVKMSEEDHSLYEQRRVLEKGSPEYQAILEKQFALYAGMAIPEKIEQLKDI